MSIDYHELLAEVENLNKAWEDAMSERIKRFYWNSSGYYGFILGNRFIGFMKLGDKRYWLFRRES